MAMAMMTMTSSEENWCDLPSDIVRLVVDRLTIHADRVRFGAVCRWWRFVLSTTVLPPCSPPYLYFIRCNELFCLKEQRTYYLPFEEHLPFTTKGYRYRLVGPSNGWFGITDSEDDFFLLEAFSGVRVDLPPLWTLPDVEVGRFDHSKNVMRYFLMPKRTPMSAYHLRKNLMLDFALSPSTMTALIIYRSAKQLALAHPGCDDWTRVVVPPDFPHKRFVDVTYHGAGSHGKFYAILQGGATISVDENHNDIVVETIVVGNNFRPTYLMGGPYLVSLDTGELLCVYILPPMDAMQPRNIEGLDFKILKLVKDETKNTWTWARVKRLDYWALFLDSHGVQARFCKEGVDYNGNSIYFALDHRVQRNEKKYQYLDCGVFDIATKNIRPIYDSKYIGRKAFWIEPQ